MKQLALLCIISIILVTPGQRTFDLPSEIEIKNNRYNELNAADQRTVDLPSATDIENNRYNELNAADQRTINPDKINQVNTRLTTDEKNKHHMIPDEAIRLRILAHSDDELDQEIKKVVRDRVNEHIRLTVADIANIETARIVIERTIPTLRELITETLIDYNQDYPFQVRFQKDVPFPLKTYGPYVYPAGDYEAILITLGDGLGENWWCVLFPPLCFIDLFNTTTLVEADDEKADDHNAIHEAEQLDETSDVEVRFFLFDLFNLS